MPVAWPDPPAPPPLEPDEPPRIADGRVFMQIALARADDLWGRAHWSSSRWGAISAGNVVDATCDVEGLTVERGREDPLDAFTPARMTASLIDPDRRWSPAAVDVTGIRPMRAGCPIRVVAMAPETGAPTYLFAGELTQLRELDDGTEPPIVALEALGSLGALAGDRVRPPAGGAGELPAVRLGRLFALASDRDHWWTTSLDTGVTPLQPFEDPGDGEPSAMLDYAQLVADSDGGAIIELADGTITYRTAEDLAARLPAWHLTDSPAGTGEVCATSMSYSLDRERVVNAAGVRAAGEDPEPPMVWAEDIESQSWYGRRPATIEDLLHTTTAEGERLAGLLLERARTGDFMVSPVMGDVMETAGWYRLALELELADPVTLSRDDGHGQRIELTTAQVQAIRHDITRGNWACQLALGGALELRTFYDRWSHGSRWGTARWA